MGALDTQQVALDVLPPEVRMVYQVAHPIFNWIHTQLNVTPADFHYAWQRDPAVAALTEKLGLNVVRGPAIGTSVLRTIPGEPGIPRFATPGFAPDGGTPVSVATPTPPPPVLPGPGSDAGLPGPISDTANLFATQGATMADWTNILGAGLDLLAGGSPSQVLNAFNAGTGPTTSNVPTLPVTSSTPATTATTGSTSHPMAKGTQYVAVFGPNGNIIGYKPVKRRRRRRKLVTQSDIAGLFELKAVFGGMRGGRDMMEAWIASRGRG